MRKPLFIAALFFFVLNNVTTAQTMERQSYTAKGSFLVNTTPGGENTKVGNITQGTYLVEKTFNGDMQATSSFKMYTAGTDEGAAAYVAVEIITGTLNGKNGSFVLLHTGTMTKISQELTLTIAPGCASGDLKGLEGKFTIKIVGKEHFYEMEYSLPK